MYVVAAGSCASFRDMTAGKKELKGVFTDWHGVGASFGEEGLLSEGAAAAEQVVAMEDRTLVVVLPASSYQRFFGGEYAVRARATQTFLRRLALVPRASRRTMRRLGGLFDLQRFPREAVLAREGARASHLFLVRTGQCVVSIGVGGCDVDLAAIGPGSVFGVCDTAGSGSSGSDSGALYTASLRTAEPTEVLALRARDLPRLPRSAQDQLLARDTRQLEHRASRMARLVAMLAPGGGQGEGRGSGDVVHRLAREAAGADRGGRGQGALTASQVVQEVLADVGMWRRGAREGVPRPWPAPPGCKGGVSRDVTDPAASAARRLAPRGVGDDEVRGPRGGAGDARDRVMGAVREANAGYDSEEAEEEEESLLFLSSPASKALEQNPHYARGSGRAGRGGAGWGGAAAEPKPRAATPRAGGSGGSGSGGKGTDAATDVATTPWRQKVRASEQAQEVVAGPRARTLTPSLPPSLVQRATGHVLLADRDVGVPRWLKHAHARYERRRGAVLWDALSREAMLGPRAAATSGSRLPAQLRHEILPGGSFGRTGAASHAQLPPAREGEQRAPALETPQTSPVRRGTPQSRDASDAPVFLTGGGQEVVGDAGAGGADTAHSATLPSHAGPAPVPSTAATHKPSAPATAAQRRRAMQMSRRSSAFGVSFVEEGDALQRAVTGAHRQGMATTGREREALAEAARDSAARYVVVAGARWEGAEREGESGAGLASPTRRSGRREGSAADLSWPPKRVATPGRAVQQPTASWRMRRAVTAAEYPVGDLGESILRHAAENQEHLRAATRSGRLSPVERAARVPGAVTASSWRQVPLDPDVRCRLQEAQMKADETAPMELGRGKVLARTPPLWMPRSRSLSTQWREGRPAPPLPSVPEEGRPRPGPDPAAGHESWARTVSQSRKGARRGHTQRRGRTQLGKRASPDAGAAGAGLRFTRRYVPLCGEPGGGAGWGRGEEAGPTSLGRANMQGTLPGRVETAHMWLNRRRFTRPRAYAVVGR